MMIISLSGNSCSGKSTVARLLSDTLGYDLFSVGAFVRSAAIEQSLTLEEFHKRTDSFVVQELIKKKYAEIRKKGDCILDSRTAWIFIPESFKVYLHASYATCAKRMMADETRTDFIGDGIEIVTQKLSQADQEEKHYFSGRFGVTYDAKNNYDLVLTSERLTPAEIHDNIMARLGEFNQQ